MSLISEIREAWGWVGIDPIEVVDENDFGNLIVRAKDGQYWRICPEDIYCEIVAENKQELEKLYKEQEFIVDWRMSELVDRAKKNLGPLDNGRKYYLVIPGPLGGAYDISNIKSISITELIRFSGDLGKQIRDLPDGASVELKIVD